MSDSGNRCCDTLVSFACLCNSLCPHFGLLTASSQKSLLPVRPGNGCIKACSQYPTEYFSRQGHVPPSTYCLIAALDLVCSMLQLQLTGSQFFLGLKSWTILRQMIFGVRSYLIGFGRNLGNMYTITNWDFMHPLRLRRFKAIQNAKYLQPYSNPKHSCLSRVPLSFSCLFCTCPRRRRALLDACERFSLAL